LTARVERLTRSLRHLPPAVGPLLLIAAIVGFLVGYRHAPATSQTPATANSTISTAGVVLEYPDTWQPAKTAPAIPGLALSHQLALAPGGDGTRAGLLSGSLPAGGAAPLPESFVAALSGNPRTEVLNLPGGQAYRYSDVRLPGYSSTLELFVIPSVGAVPTALACYAPSAVAVELKECEQIVAGVTLESQSQNDLTPDAIYGGRLASVLGTLDRERVQLRGELHTRTTAAQTGAVATRLATLFEEAITAVGKLEPPLAAGRAAATLTSALTRARDAYRALSAAASGELVSAYALARERVEQAESRVDSALQGFALIGYGRG
jgi:hypothetical protein